MTVRVLVGLVIKQVTSQPTCFFLLQIMGVEFYLVKQDESIDQTSFISVTCFGGKILLKFISTTEMCGNVPF